MKLAKNRTRIVALILAAVLMIGTGGVPVDAAGSSKMPANVVIGYWENWVNGETPNIKLREVNPGWDVVIVSFMICDSTNYIAKFDVDDTLYPGSNREADFKADVEFCQARGQKVLISAGGATGALSLNSEAQRDAYLDSVIKIVDKFGFDGIDIDFENSILNVSASDTLNNPTTNIQNYMNYILHKLVERYGRDFMVTMAPEHPYVQGAVLAWSGYYGGYLPLIHLTRDILTFVHPQYYNNPISGYDGSWGGENLGFSGYNANSLIKLSEMLINGFTTAKGEKFEGLRPDQVAIGVPCTSNAAGSGYLPLSEYQSALGTLIQKYPDFRGIMTWSINYDAANHEFVTKMQETIDQYKQVEPEPTPTPTPQPLSIAEVKTDPAGNTFTVETEGGEGAVRYSYYFMKGGKVVKSAAYSYNNQITFDAPQPGTYTVRVYAQDRSGKRVVKSFTCQCA